jgi:hypothetical protein
MARPFEQPRLASPRSMSLLAPDRLARHEREILGVMPPLARSGAGARYGRRRQGAVAPSRRGGDGGRARTAATS